MISNLHLENFRIFPCLDLEFKEPGVILAGANGQGKTSVLEAIFFLSTLRSFRTSKIREMRRIGADSFRIASTLAQEKWNTRLEVESFPASRSLKLDGCPVARSSDFAGRFNVVAFLPDDSNIIGGTSVLRRRFFDMFISMLDRTYFTALQHYSAALKERNFLLRTPSCDPAVLASFHPILAKNGAFIVKKRAFYARMAADFMREIFAEIRPEFHRFEIRMRSSGETESEEAFRKRLDERSDYDRQKGFTAVGPHLDDFDFIADDRNLRIYGSNGQRRIASFALKMAEYDIICAGRGAREKTAVIIDDATGDLDYRTKQAFFEKIKSAGQIFYAFTDVEDNPVFRNSQIITLSAGKAR